MLQTRNSVLRIRASDLRLALGDQQENLKMERSMIESFASLYNLITKIATRKVLTALVYYDSYMTLSLALYALMKILIT